MNNLKLIDSELCETDGMIQTTKHLVEEYPAHHFPEGMKSLHASEEDAAPYANWLSKLEKEV